MWACRPRDRWTACRFAWATGLSAIRAMPPRLKLPCRGPTLKFGTDATICLTGALMPADIDGRPIGYWTPIRGACRRDSTIGRRSRGRMPRLSGDSRRLRRAAIFGQPRDVHLGQVRRPRRPGACWRATCCIFDPSTARGRAPARSRPSLIPDIADEWEIGVLYGPHGAPDFFTTRISKRFFPRPAGRFITTPAARACG